MKKIIIKSVQEVVAVIDYSQYQTVRVGKPIQTSQDIIAIVQLAVTLPYYERYEVDFVNKTITLLKYSDQIVVE